MCHEWLQKVKHKLLMQCFVIFVIDFVCLINYIILFFWTSFKIEVGAMIFSSMLETRMNKKKNMFIGWQNNILSI